MPEEDHRPTRRRETPPAAVMATPVMAMGNRPIGGRSYILPQHKVMFVSAAKNACTSIKWLLADLSGQDPSRFYASFAMISDPADAIHQRRLWEGIRKYHVADDSHRARFSADNGWFVFGVVREPRARLFSAWQSKFANHDPWYAQYADEAFYPDVPQSTAEVVDGFARFVRFLVDNPEHPLATTDAHFAAQSALLQSWRVNYTQIYDVTELGELMSDLRAHLARLGLDPGGVTLPRDNATPLKAHRLVFDNGIGELIEEYYAPDFAEFGDRWPADPIPDTDPGWTPEVFRAMAATAAAYERVEYLTVARRDLHARLQRAENRIAELEGSASHLGGRVLARELAGRLRRRVLPR